MSDAPNDTAAAVMHFAEAILHGDDDHREWLLEAAAAFNAGEPMPQVNGKGRAEAAEKRAAKWKRAYEKANKQLAAYAREIVEERERCARIVEGYPEQVLQFYDRPGGPPGNMYRQSTHGDIAAAIRKGATNG